MKTSLFAKTHAAAVIAALLTSPVAGAGTLERMDAFRDVLKLHYVDGDNSQALKLANALLSSPAADATVRTAAKSEVDELSETNPRFKLDKAVKFITGKKTEIYCEGQGLVEMTGQHNDGAWSKIVLTDSQRKLAKGSFSVLESGTWSEELSNTYRKPMSSSLNLLSSSASSFSIKERRELSPQGADLGSYNASWTEDGKMNAAFGGQGNVKEPLPVYMSLDYQLWGNTDLGYRIKFTPGYTDTHVTRETGAAKDILLNSTRTVGSAIAEYETKDSAGNVRRYKNCYPVSYDIKLKELVALKPHAEGSIDRGAIRAVVNRNLNQVRACYDQIAAHAPKLHGHVILEWTIDDQGIVTKASLKARSLMSDGEESGVTRDDLVACLLNRVKTWRFPAAPSGQVATVAYPFTFSE